MEPDPRLARRSEIPQELTVLPGGFSLASERDRGELLTWLESKRPVLVAVDTLAAAIGGLDENDAGEMGVVLGWAREVYRRTGALTVLVHHPPKSDPGTARGSGVLEANVDGTLHLTAAKDGTVQLRAKKLRAGRPGPALHFVFRTLDLGEDPDRPGRRLEDSVLEPRQANSRREIELLALELGEERGWPLDLAALKREWADGRDLTERAAEDAVKAAIPWSSGTLWTSHGCRLPACSRQRPTIGSAFSRPSGSGG